MRKTILAAGIAMVLALLLPASQGRAIDCYDAGSAYGTTCRLDELMAGADITWGGLVFDDFGSYSVNSGGIPAVTADQFVVDKVSINGEYGLKFQKAIVAINSQFIDISFDFSVTCEDGIACLTDNTLIMNGSGAGLGSAVVIETVFNADNPTDAVSKFAMVTPYFNVFQPVDHQDFPNGPWTTAIVAKDIFVYGNILGICAPGIFCGIGVLSDFIQTFSQDEPPPPPVPEPSTLLLLGTGLIGVAVWGRKRYGDR